MEDERNGIVSFSPNQVNFQGIILAYIEFETDLE